MGNAGSSASAGMPGGGGTGGAGMGGAGMGAAGTGACYELGPVQSTKPPAQPPPGAFVASMETRDDMTLPVPHYVCLGEFGPGKAIFGNYGDGCYMPGPNGAYERDIDVRILTVKSASCLMWQTHSGSQTLPNNAVRLAGVLVCRAHEVAVPTEKPRVTSTGDHAGQVQMNVCRYELYGALRSADNYELLVEAPKS